jgi:exoribonuclease-2
MYALFEEGGKFLAGRVLSEAEASLQVELDSGKRVKLKSAQALMRFAAPAPPELLKQAQAEAAGIELDLAWEFAPADEFGFAELAAEYFSSQPTVVQQAAALMRLFEAPHYFRRLGRGRFKKASQETVQAALAGIERKRQQAEQVQAWAKALAAGECPAEVAEQLFRILFKPDKQSLEYKAVVQAARDSARPPLELLKAAGAIRSPYQFHWRRFLFEQFPKGSGFAADLTAPALKESLPRASVQAFSIDDSATTEIDDALSVQGLGSGEVRFGIHIAAPGLALVPDSALDRVARSRLSTVYMPGWKLTMLPEAVVQSFTLAQGRDCPALSLYLRFDEATLELRGSETRIEQVPIAANLRHDQLQEVVTEATLSGEAPASYAFAAELAFAFRLARHLKTLREQARGKPETFNRPDYNFRLLLPDGRPIGAEPQGDERVQISVRPRGSALDLVVAEAMILANAHWGGWLAECGVPGIYRSQAALAPGVKVRMGVKPAPHAGMGVPQYIWATSPLRRYTDLVNQWQLIACARHGRTAALVAPFKPKDSALFAVISAFEAAYGAYNDFQGVIERYWSLRHVEQAGLRELPAAVMKDGLVRAETLPLVFRVPGCEALPRGARVLATVKGIDLLTLELFAGFGARLDEASAAGDVAAGDEADEEATAAGPLSLAIDIADAAEPGGASEGIEPPAPAPLPASH